MPVYVEISPLHRLVTIVAHGTLTSDEVRSTAQKVAEARVRRFAKIVEVAGTPRLGSRRHRSARADSAR